MYMFENEWKLLIWYKLDFDDKDLTYLFYQVVPYTPNNFERYGDNILTSVSIFTIKLIRISMILNKD